MDYLTLDHLEWIYLNVILNDSPIFLSEKFNTNIEAGSLCAVFQ